MRLIIAGNRDMRLSVNTIIDTLEILELTHQVKEIISASHLIGVSWAAEEFSVEVLNKNARTFPGEWHLGVEALDFISMEMAENADAAVLFTFDVEEPEIISLRQHLNNFKKPIYEVKFMKNG